MEMHRQGDLLFVFIGEETPTELETLQPLDHLIVEEGEATGHAHRVTEGEAALFVHNQLKYLVAQTQALVTHEEHKPTTLRRGTWKVVRQREYTPEEIHYVAD